MSTYRDHVHRTQGVNGVTVLSVRHSWRNHTLSALRWQHGEDRVRAIALGQDPATNADLKAWRELGR